MGEESREGERGGPQIVMVCGARQRGCRAGGPVCMWLCSRDERMTDGDERES